MNIKDLIPWSRGGREVPVRREGTDPMLALQSDIDRVFENFWRTSDLPMPGSWGAGLASAAAARSTSARRTKRSRWWPSCPAWTKRTSR